MKRNLNANEKQYHSCRRSNNDVHMHYRYQNEISRGDRNRKANRKSSKSIAMAVALVLAIILIVALSLQRPVQAGETAQHPVKYYKTIVIQQNDTLWSIAEQYCGKNSGAEDRWNYIAEIKKINQTGSKIKAGMNLIVPYYK